MLDLRAVWVAEPHLPSLPPEVKDVARLVVNSIPSDSVHKWARGHFQAVRREMAAKKRRLDSEEFQRRTGATINGKRPMVRRRPGPSQEMVAATWKCLNSVTVAMIALATLAATRTVAELFPKDKNDKY